MSDQRPRGRGLGRGNRGGGGQGGSQGAPPHQRGPGGPPQQQPPAGPQGAWGARAQQPQQPQQSQWGGQRPAQVAPPPAGSAWGPRPGGGSAPPAAPGGGPTPRPQGPPVAGRASTRPTTERVTEQMSRVDIGGAGDAGGARARPAASAGASGGGDPPASGRGSTRGRRNQAVEVIRTRPQTQTTKCGTHGQPVQLQANYFELINRPDWRLYCYRVDYAPQEDETRCKKMMLRVHKETLGRYIFDGTVLMCTHALKPDPMELCSEHPINKSPVQISLRIVSDIAYGDHHYLQFYNTLMRTCLRYLEMQLVGRDMYDPAAKIRLNDLRLELWPGYITSMRQHESKMLLCSEITHKVMRADTVYELFRDCYQQSKENSKKSFQLGIIGQIVLTDYNNRTYRIDDVDWETTPDSTFQKKDGSHISYRQYFKEKYNLAIRVNEQPMLVSRAKKSEIRSGDVPDLIYLVPELCRMTGLTDQQRANFTTMRALAQYTRVAPGDRIKKLLAFNQRLLTQKDVVQELKEWDIKISNNLVTLPGRVYPPEIIVQGSTGKIQINGGEEADWTRDLRSNEMLSCAQVSRWVCITTKFVRQGTEQFCQMLCKAASGMRFNLGRPEIVEIPDDRLPTYLNALENVISKAKPQFIMCVVTNNKSDRYGAIKKKCCVDKAVITQVILSKHFNNQKGLMSVATKVAIQINCKLGGAPWTVQVPMPDLMVIGFDVCHDSIDKSQSYGGLVASLNPTFSRYFSYVSQHKRGEELSNDFAFNVAKAVRKYITIGGKPPGRILIYRDGVGDGQIAHVLEHEVKAIREKLAEYYPNNSLKLAFVIVSKRINTRFFLRGNNPVPGTVVDDVVTLPERYDFFIVSQHVRQGTVAPTSYNVIYDTLGLEPDKIQRLTYKFCHMYYNFSGTVRVPAPCQYAHKLAFLAGQALHRNPNPELETTLYYL